MIPSPVGNVPITPTLALITLILVVVGGAIVTGAILAFLFYRFNRMLVALQNPAPAVQRRVHAVHHPGYGVYLMVFVWLVILTLAEVGITYIPVAHAVIIPFLVVIALVKATLVALFYMHLKYDSPIYSIAVGMPLVLVIIFAWFVLQMQWGLVPPPLP